MTSYTLAPIGVVRSALTDLDQAPRQGDEGAPDAWLELVPAFIQGMSGLAVGDELVVLTWLHLAEREVLQVQPRSDPTRALMGVFATRSPDRPNPIGLHRATVLEVSAAGLRVAPIEAIDGTPIVDIKPVLGDIAER